MLRRPRPQVHLGAAREPGQRRRPRRGPSPAGCGGAHAAPRRPRDPGHFGDEHEGSAFLALQNMESDVAFLGVIHRKHFFHAQLLAGLGCSASGTTEAPFRCLKRRGTTESDRFYDTTPNG